MEMTDEWKALFPVNKIFAPPLLSNSRVGPLFFSPNQKTLNLLFSSPALASPPPLPIPQLTLTAFLGNFSLPFSTSTSIESQLGSNHTLSQISYNRLRLLHCPIHKSVIVFFPTGYNQDQFGFLVVSCKKYGFVGFGDDNNNFFSTNTRFNGQICGILVNPVEEDVSGNSFITVGYVLVFTMYSVHWFSVEVSKDSEKPAVNCLGFKLFKSCSVVGACWSPHLPNESVVLLQSGDLFMFDMDSFLQIGKLTGHFKGKRLRVSWDNDSVSSQKGKWLGCEFSWHPRILIVVRSDAVFLVDLRLDGCNVSLLAKIDKLSLYAPVEKERFLAFCKAGSDGFTFILVSDCLLILCDVRKPLMPLLRWAHGLDKPDHVESFRLTELRSNSRDDAYDQANELGFGILLGCFRNCEFSLFCYGPTLPGLGEPFASKISKYCKSLYAWELPSNLLLSGRDCYCRSCLVREKLLRDAFPNRKVWQQKKDIVLGFGILSGDLSAVLHEVDEFGGFTLLRLMSSGKLEAQRYCASWELVKKFESTHGNSLMLFENNLCSKEGEDYKLHKKFPYFKFEYLCAHLDGNLTELMDSKVKNSANGPQDNGSFSIDIHEILCEKLKVSGFSRFRKSPIISFVFKDISLPVSIREVALRRIWAGLPMELLQLAFSSYTEILGVVDKNKKSLEFSVVPDLPQLPPFFLRKPSCQSNKMSKKVQHSDVAVGPVVPLPVLVTLDEFRNGCQNSEAEAEASRFSSEAELGLHCNEVMQVASEMAVSDSAFEFHYDHVVSLSNNRDEMWVDSQKSKPFIVYPPTGFATKNHEHENCSYKDVRFSNMILKVADYEPVPKDKVDSVELDRYDDLSPIALKYDACTMNIMAPELKTYNILKWQFSRWQESFALYQEFCTRFNLKKQ